jgi:hypothetical protein
LKLKRSWSSVKGQVSGHGFGARPSQDNLFPRGAITPVHVDLLAHRASEPLYGICPEGHDFTAPVPTA